MFDVDDGSKQRLAKFTPGQTGRGPKPRLVRPHHWWGWSLRYIVLATALYVGLVGAVACASPGQ